MDVSRLQPPSETVAVRVGCALSYEANGPASVLLLVRPQLCAGQRMVEESITFSNGMVGEELRDHQGNAVLRATLAMGLNDFLYEAVIEAPRLGDNHGLAALHAPIERLSMEVLRYTFPSRYCESDRLVAFARQRFGQASSGIDQVRAVCDWVHTNIEYRYGSGSQSISACDAIVRGYGVCRDFAHVVVALCRALDLPARYVAGHLPRLDCGDPLQANEKADTDIGIDFHAYAEVYLGGHWHTFDARYNRPMVGRIKIAHGMDAVDAAFATIYGDAAPAGFRAWSRQVAQSGAGDVGDHMAAVPAASTGAAESPESAEQAADRLALVAAAAAREAAVSRHA